MAKLVMAAGLPLLEASSQCFSAIEGELMITNIHGLTFLRHAYESP